MPKQDGSPTVAERRAAGTNNASINQAAKAAGTFTGNVGKAPSPVPSSTPLPSSSSYSPPNSSPSSSASSSSSPSSSYSPSTSPAPSSAPASSYNSSHTAAKAKAMSVKDRRAAAKASGVSLRAFKQGEINTTFTPSNTKKPNSLSPWDNLRANFNQGDWDAEVAGHRDEYFKNTPGSGMSRNWQAAQLGENGFTMDSNRPNMIPALGKYGFKAGDYAFDPNGYGIHDGNKDGRDGAGITGRISYVKKNGEVGMERDGASSVNPNWDKYAASGSARMSSEGLYQDRYNVGYHGADDEGDKFASTGALGDIGSYFKGYNTGEKSFGEAYDSWADGNRKGGYAGDVLKMIDQDPTMTVSDDDYNMLVVDAQNYDWVDRGKVDGQDAHGNGQSYDARAGGQSQKNITANQNFYANRNAGYHQAGAMDPAEAAAKYGNTAQSQTSYEAPNNNFFNYEMPNLGLNMGPQYQGWQEQMGNASQSPYASRSKSSNMNFNFNPYKFQQGQ